ncbi:hypothetical protein [Sphingomonas oligophenolica]|nr:hypothetical protein [Sphingomonas oligophenolica]
MTGFGRRAAASPLIRSVLLSMASFATTALVLARHGNALFA